MSTIAAIAVASLCGMWLLFYARAAFVVTRIGVFETLDVDERQEWPKISVIIPACNEAQTIRPALESLRSIDYPSLELIVIDDRSTDETGEIIDEIAARDTRIVPVHVTELRDGWLGKLNAMDVGLEYASGDYLLFTDADIHFGHDALRRAVSAVERRELDHLTIIPAIESAGVFLQSVITAFGMLMVLATRPHTMEDPAADGVLGVGAFNLVSREMYDRTPGLEWIRMDVADDSALAYMLREHGARQKAVVSHGDVLVEWYPTLGALLRGVDKNLFGVGAKYRVPRAALGILVAIGFSVAPFVALFYPGGVVGAASAAVALASAYVGSVVVTRRLRRPALQVALVPLANFVIAFALLRSTLLTLLNDGITWRGTHYPMAELREHQRLDL